MLFRGVYLHFFFFFGNGYLFYQFFVVVKITLFGCSIPLKRKVVSFNLVHSLIRNGCWSFYSLKLQQTISNDISATWFYIVGNLMKYANICQAHRVGHCSASLLLTKLQICHATAVLPQYKVFLLVGLHKNSFLNGKNSRRKHVSYNAAATDEAEHVCHWTLINVSHINMTILLYCNL